MLTLSPIYHGSSPEGGTFGREKELSTSKSRTATREDSAHRPGHESAADPMFPFSVMQQSYIFVRICMHMCLHLYQACPCSTTPEGMQARVPARDDEGKRGKKKKRKRKRQGKRNRKTKGGKGIKVIKIKRDKKPFHYFFTAHTSLDHPSSRSFLPPKAPPLFSSVAMARVLLHAVNASTSSVIRPAPTNAMATSEFLSATTEASSMHSSR